MSDEVNLHPCTKQFMAVSTINDINELFRKDYYSHSHQVKLKTSSNYTFFDNVVIFLQQNTTLDNTVC